MALGSGSEGVVRPLLVTEALAPLHQGLERRAGLGTSARSSRQSPAVPAPLEASPSHLSAQHPLEFRRQAVPEGGP